MIHWNYGPEILSLGPIVIRWYGLLFAIGFYLGFRFLRYFFAEEGFQVELVDKLLIYVIVGTIGGARVGHCLFYEPEIYLRDPLRILKVWEGGLASHGGTLGVVIALWFFGQKYRMPWTWLLDRVSTPVPLAGGLVRIGNLFNSEILGSPTQAPWAFVFTKVDDVPRHPAQLYEALTYWMIFGALIWLYQKRPATRRWPGFFFGLFLISVYGARFFLEFAKESQVSFEQSLPLNMGQLLSIPAVLVGVFLILRSRRIAPYPQKFGKR